MPVVIALYGYKIFGPRSVSIVVSVPLSSDANQHIFVSLVLKLPREVPGKQLWIFLYLDSVLVFPRELRGIV